MLDAATAVGSVLAAFGLAGAAGLNAWIPLLAAGLLDRAGQLQLADGYDVIATTPGLIVLGVLALIVVAVVAVLWWRRLRRARRRRELR